MASIHLSLDGVVEAPEDWYVPVVVGSGKRLFSEGGDLKSWQLVGTTPSRSGAVVLAYTPVARPPSSS